MIYTEANLETLVDFDTPEPNEDHPGMSAHNRCRRSVQLGLVEARLRLHARRGHGVRFRLNDAADFVRALEERFVAAMARCTESWFGKRLRLDDVRAMFKSSMLQDRRGRSSVMMRASDSTRIFEHAARETRQGSLASLRPDVACCVKFRVDGLWIEEERWGASLVATDILVFPNDVRDSDEEGSDSEEDSDIETEVRRRFQMQQRGRQLTSDDALFRELREETLEEEETSSWHSRMPFGRKRETRRDQSILPAVGGGSREGSSRDGGGSHPSSRWGRHSLARDGGSRAGSRSSSSSTSSSSRRQGSIRDDKNDNSDLSDLDLELHSGGEEEGDEADGAAPL